MKSHDLEADVAPGPAVAARCQSGRSCSGVEAALAAYFASSLLVFLGVFLGTDFLYLLARSDRPQFLPSCGEPVLDGVDQWDGQDYLTIAKVGYDYDSNRGSMVAFFPVYPALVAAVYHGMGVPIEVAGLVVAHLSLALAFVVFWAYCDERFGAESSRLTVWAVFGLAFFPTTFFMRMTYSESLFLFLAVAAMLGMKRGWNLVWIAALVGLATGTRAVGVALIPPFALCVWQRSPSWRQALVRGIPLCLLATWGLLAFMVFQYVEFGTATAFIQTQSHWHARPEAGWGQKAVALLTLEPIWSAYLPSWPGYCGNLGNGIPDWCDLQLANPVYFVAAVGLVILGAAKRWLTAGETLLSAGLILIPYVTRSFEMCMMSQGRFMSVVFPMYLVLGRMLAALPLIVSVGIVVLAGLFLAIYAALFSAGFLMI